MGRKKRVERYQVKRFKNPAGGIVWRVSGTDFSGNRIRENHRDRADAIERKAELEKATPSTGDEEAPVSKMALRRTTLSDVELAEAETATAAAGSRPLGPLIHRLLQVEEAAKAKGVKVQDMIHFFSTHYRPEIKPMSLLNGYARFIQDRRDSGVYQRTLKNYEHALSLLLKPDPNKPIHEVTVQDLDRILSRYRNRNSKRTHKQTFTTFFEWALRHHHCLENPCKRLSRIQPEDRLVSILSLDEVKRLLKAALCYREGLMVPSVAIALFAGLRPSELEALTAEDIRSAQIRVRGGKRRRETSRMVPIPDNLKIWLRAYPFSGHSGSSKRHFNILRQATKARHWVQDVLRHTSISFQLERDKNEALTCFNNGTSKQMVDRHYRKVIEDLEEVEAFWTLTPDSLEKVKVKLPTYTAPKAVNWPSDKKLLQLVASLPMTQVGKAIGVSDNAVRKRLKKRGLVAIKRADSR